MRLLHVDSGREMRGGQWQALRLMGGLLQRGHEVRLLAPSGSPLFEEARRCGIPVETLSPPALRRLSAGVDLVHVHDAKSHTVAAGFAAAALVVSRRVAFPLRKGMLSRWKYSRASHYIAVSKYVAGVLEHGGVSRQRISVVPDGVPLLELSDQSRPAIAAASDDPMKGTALARQSASLAALPLEFSRNLAIDLRHASLFLYLTSSEGLGSGILMAMSAGVPVIASSVGGIPEIVRHNETGLLVANEAEPVAVALRWLSSHPDEARRLAGNARRLVEGGFTVDHMVDRTLAVYERVTR